MTTPGRDNGRRLSPLPYGLPVGAQAITAAWAQLDEMCRQIIAAEESRHQPEPDLWWDADVCADRLGIELRGQLWTLRGPATTPDGTHSVFLGCRCVYCNANNLDVGMYTLDPDACPPQWLCSAAHPDSRQTWCTQPQNHPDDHRRGQRSWAKPAPAKPAKARVDTGTKTVRRPWWKNTVVLAAQPSPGEPRLCDGPAVEHILHRVLASHSHTGDVDDALDETAAALGLDPYDVWLVVDWASLAVSPVPLADLAPLGLTRRDDLVTELLAELHTDSDD